MGSTTPRPVELSIMDPVIPVTVLRKLARFISLEGTGTSEAVLRLHKMITDRGLADLIKLISALSNYKLKFLILVGPYRRQRKKRLRYKRIYTGR